MQVQNLQLSNIVSREQHFLKEFNCAPFQFQHQPITHSIENKYVTNQKKVMKYKDQRERKELLEKSQMIKKDLLLQKIASKNYRYQIRQNSQKQNKNAQIAELFERKSPELQKRLNQSNQKCDTANIQRIYLKNTKVPFSSTKGFSSNKQKGEVMLRMFNTKDYNQESSKNIKPFKQIQMKAVKLPQLNSGKQEEVRQVSKDQVLQKVQASFPKKVKQQQQSSRQVPINPILKVHDSRYFGIEARQEDFYKIGKNLAKLIRKKYWSYESLDNQQVLNNFQNLLADGIV